MFSFLNLWNLSLEVPSIGVFIDLTMAAVGTRSKRVDEKMDKQDHSIQQIQGEVSQIRSDVQAVFKQMNDLTFKFST